MDEIKVRPLPGNKYTIEKIQLEIKVKKPGLALLSTEYKDCFSPLKWYCKKCDNSFYDSLATVKGRKK